MALITRDTVFIVMFIILLSGIPVYAKVQQVNDSKTLSELIAQRQDSIAQWSIQNQNDIDKLKAMNESLELDKKNSTKNFVQSWESLEEVKKSTGNVLKASSALWEEFGSANLYYAAFKKSDYWQKCLEAGNCQTKESLQNIDEKSIEFATRAYQSADIAKDSLQNQLDILNTIVLEARDAESYADNLDVLSKISTQTTASLYELNTQMATMLQLLSHDMASTNSKSIAEYENSRDFIRLNAGKAQDVVFNYSHKFN